MARTHTLEVASSKHSELIDVTARVTPLVKAAGLKDGLCTVFSPHTTAAVTINENADPDVQRDLLFALERAVPNEGFHHGEGNSDAHTKVSMVGPSVTVIVEDGALKLGTWQGIYLCEFDGPRRRTLYVQLLG